jgi:integrase
MASITKRTIRWTTQGGEPKTTERYEAVYRDRTGNRHRRLFVLKKEAQRWLDEQTAGLVTGQWADPRASRETVRAYGERWLRGQVLARSTAATYGTTLSNHIFPMLGAMRMDAINRVDVQSLVKEWEGGSAAARTVETRYSILAIMFRAAVKERLIPATPCVDITLPKTGAKSALVPISTETVIALRDELPERYRAFVTIAAGSGMRRGEILGLTLDRIALDFGTIRVDRQLARSSRVGMPVWGLPKTESSTRTIPVGDVVVDAIKQHVEDFGQHESGLLFTTDLGSFVGTSTLHGAWQRAARRVGTDATPHDLRHYFASVQIRGGQSIKVLQALLGHKSAVETWDTYGHLMGDEDDRSRAVIDAALGGADVGRRSAEDRRPRLAMETTGP